MARQASKRDCLAPPQAKATGSEFAKRATQHTCSGSSRGCGLGTRQARAGNAYYTSAWHHSITAPVEVHPQGTPMQASKVWPPRPGARQGHEAHLRGFGTRHTSQPATLHANLLKGETVCSQMDVMVRGEP